MASKKPLVIDLIVRTIGSQLALRDRPKFSDTSIMVGEWQGFRVEAQFGSAYLPHNTPMYSADLEFLTERELEQVLLQAAALISTWSSESETA